MLFYGIFFCAKLVQPEKDTKIYILRSLVVLKQHLAEIRLTVQFYKKQSLIYTITVSRPKVQTIKPWRMMTLLNYHLRSGNN